MYTCISDTLRERERERIHIQFSGCILFCSVNFIVTFFSARYVKLKRKSLHNNNPKNKNDIIHKCNMPSKTGMFSAVNCNVQKQKIHNAQCIV